MSLSFHLNGAEVRTEIVRPEMTFLEYLRSEGQTGTKEGCAEGECGACAVALVESDADGKLHYRIVNSCLLLLGSCAGRELYTVESLVDGAALHPVQQAMCETGGSQCGYCTPGFVMALFGEYYRSGRTAGEIPVESLSGNLCRCTGYRPIRDAARKLPLPDPNDRFQQRLQNPALPVVENAAPSASFSVPPDLAALLELLEGARTSGTLERTRMIAGGTDAVVEMNLLGRRYDHLISLEHVGELRGIRKEDSHYWIGAGESLENVLRALGDEVPVLAELFPLFASRLIRNRATLGGNIATASPIGDAAPVLLALDTVVHFASADAQNSCALAEFFLDYRKTQLPAHGVITGFEIPRPVPAVTRFFKVSKRVHDDISTVSGAFSLQKDGDVVADCRLAFGGVAATPIRATVAEQTLAGNALDAASVDAVAEALEQTFSPMDDHRGSAAYRNKMVANLFRKFAHEQGVAL